MGRPAEGLDLAQEVYENGDLDRAARLIRNEHQRAIKRHDDELVADVDAVWEQMRTHLDGEELARFDAIVATGRAAAAPADELDSTPLGFWLAIVGAGAMAIAVFMPELSATTFSQVVHNTLIQNGDGWLFVALAVGDVGAMYAAYRGRRRTWGPVDLGRYRGCGSGLRRHEPFEPEALLGDRPDGL